MWDPPKAGDHHFVLCLSKLVCCILQTYAYISFFCYHACFICHSLLPIWTFGSEFSFAFQVDQMVIHSASDPRPKTTLCGDYFYNYFTRGLDILFDGEVGSSSNRVTCSLHMFSLFMTLPFSADSQS